MTSVFDPIREDFEHELNAIRSVVSAFSNPADGNPRTRVAAANSATLLLAATFEEFVREMARAYARAVVNSCGSNSKLPALLIARAWQRTLDSLARMKIDGKEGIPTDALSRFTVVYDFCRGDLSQDIYRDLIHNENNMRPSEINSMFKVSGLNNACKIVCGCDTMAEYLGEKDVDAANGILVSRLEAFFERRNQVAHSISTMTSSSAQLIFQDIELLDVFSHALSEQLFEHAPAENTATD